MNLIVVIYNQMELENQIE